MRKTMDDVTLLWYDSDDEVVERRVPWFKGPNATLWDASVKFRSMQKTMQKFLHFILNAMNQKEGFHILQALYGCTLRDNGTVLASLSHHLDGKPFMSLNMESARFIAETPDAQKIAQRFNFNESELQEIRKMFVNTCIPHITELLSLGNCTFSRKGDHSHYFYDTVTTDFTSNMTSYTMRRTLDDVTLMWYNGDDEVVERRVPWYKSPYATLLDASVQFYYIQIIMQRLLHNISYHTNHTEGFHILQVLEGCSLYDNGTVQASFIYRYDGKPFMHFNVESARFIAETPDAERFAQRFNSNKTVLQEIRHILVNTCIPHITDLLSLGNCTFSRKEVPIVKVTQIPVDNGTFVVHCRAYGHYPKDIFIIWYKNGQQISEDMLERTTLPLLDLTYLTSLSFIVTSIGDDVYTCRVNHSSMLRDFTQDWRISGDFGDLSSAPSGPSVGSVIAICLAVILIIIMIVFCSVSFAISRRQ
ncbi:major histocompatibility complex class I-related gene protein-like isoform X2 [Ranitomeya imitator]|uniref:major histocompatibility complex class I-related gene protein-like isoform X2 n=1 Tax=Ranitomeya imitator TaxID=111125 RepID=UPI0037E89296